MAPPTRCIAYISRSSLLSSIHTRRFPEPPQFSQLRAVATGARSANAAKYKRKELSSAQKKKKSRSTYLQYDLKDAEKFSLCDAMRYIRAFEVARPPTSPKYELHVRLRTLKNGSVIRNRLRLQHPVKTDLKICVICPPDSKQAEAAKAAGAYLVGEDEVFEQIKEGKIDFDRCLCHQDSLQKLNKAGLGRILGPKGLMPSAKTGTVVKDITAAVEMLVGASEYRERLGVLRIAIGQLGFTPEMMQANIRQFIEQIKKDASLMSDRISKDIHEVVLSSTNSPGFTLSGDFRTLDGIAPEALRAPN